VTRSMSWLCPRNAPCVESVVTHADPSRIAPYSPMKVFPVFGVIELVTEWTPALKQNVVPPGLALIADWIEEPGKTLIAEGGQAMDGCGPTCATATVGVRHSNAAHRTARLQLTPKGA
jgi:hypothetical protein